MHRRSSLATLLLVFAISLTVFATHTPAQCFNALPGLGPINGLTDNPFQAEVKHTFLPENTSFLQTGPGGQRVARDAQGRVRIEWSAGKFKVQNGPDVGTEQEQRNINICDPVKGESISLDTLNKIATVQKVRILGAPPAGLPAPPQPSFCSRQFLVPPNVPSTQVEDLGHRTIEGLEAQGMLQRRAIQLRNSRSGDTTTVLRDVINVTEIWCSEELGTIILRVIGTEKNSNTQTIAMVNIQRGEPDATLFQIPLDYRIVERVNNSTAQTGVGIVGSMGVGSSTGQIAVPDKP